MARRLPKRVLLGTSLLVGLIVIWARRVGTKPRACPYGQRFALDLPRPFLGRERLLSVLAPAAGERVLEVGPGTGYYTLAVANAIGPGGRLDALDLQQPMLDELARRAERRRIANVVPTQGDAQRLPYPDATFDAAFLVATLGEIPDGDRALAELRRVLKRGGRLVVGEGQPDPHKVPPAELRRRTEAHGLGLEEQAGGRLGYLVGLRRS
jgi:ubiquinone/menaquinone biosynthesis C-methylase UbiE